MHLRALAIASHVPPPSPHAPRTSTRPLSAYGTPASHFRTPYALPSS